ncbi:hypothetical protein QZH41_006488 [Actinostola sp. cb2023]|nr:hypothetical protein QZH41_006488 [Actinostola sp. cb2023]
MVERSQTGRSMITARSRHDHGTITARSRHDHGTITAQSRRSTITHGTVRHDHGTITARSRHDHGTITARSRHDHGTITAQSRRSTITARSRHDHGTITAQSRRSTITHGTITARSRHDHGTARHDHGTDSFTMFTGGNKANTPNLDYIENNGVKASYMLTVTPTKTWPTHQTYLTGMYPESHGIVSNYFWDPLYDEMFILQYDCSNFDPKFYEAAEPIWLTVQKLGYRSAVHYWPGYFSYKEKPSLYEKLTCFQNCTALNSHYKDLPRYRNKTRSGWPPYIHCFANQSLPFKNRIDKLIGWLKQKRPPKFSALYINEPDSTGHTYGISTGDFVKAIERVDKDVVGYLTQSLKNANLFDKMNVIIVSDHSMIETSSARTIYLSDFVDITKFQMAEQGVIGHLWPSPGQEDEIYANLTKANVTNMRVYKKIDIPEKLHWKHNRRIPPIYIEPDIGWVVKTKRPAKIVPWKSAGSLVLPMRFRLNCECGLSASAAYLRVRLICECGLSVSAAYLRVRLICECGLSASAAYLRVRLICECGLSEEDDLPYEEEILRNPYSVKCWMRYVEHKTSKAGSKSSINMIYERALKELPGSYKLWYNYLKLRRKQVKGKPLTDPAYEDVNNAFERSLVFMHKVNGIFIFVIDLLEPENTEEYVKYLVSIGWTDEAATRLATIVNKLWHDLCEMISKNPNKVKSLKVADIIRGGLHKFTDSLGQLWCLLADFYIRSGHFEKARDVYEEAIQTVMTVRDFGQFTLANKKLVFDAYAQFEESMISAKMETTAEMGANEEEDVDLELRLARFEKMMDRRPLLLSRNYQRALELMRKATAVPSSKTDYYDQGETVQKRVHKSLKLWSMYADLEESLGTFQSTKAVYGRILDLRIANPQIIINYALFLEEHRYFEESFKVFERGVAMFKWPNVFDIWNTYLSKFIRRYMFNLYIKRAAEIFGVTHTREIFEQAIEVLQDDHARQMCIRFAEIERKLGEIDRARAVYMHASQISDPRRTAEFWKTWNDFEVHHGNEDTFREMLRIKRSVQAQFNTQVNFMSAQMLAAAAGKAGGEAMETTDEMKKLEQQVLAAAEQAKREATQPKEKVLFVRGETTDDTSEVAKTANPEEIDIDDDDDDEDDQETATREIRIEKQTIPRERYADVKVSVDASCREDSD